MTDDRMLRGREIYARNFGVDAETAQRLMEQRAGAEYVAESFFAAGGPGWEGDALTDRDRAIAVVTAMVAQGVTDDRLAVYLDLARRNGVSGEGLTRLMILLTAYLGQPVTSAAMQAVRRDTREGGTTTPA